MAKANPTDVFMQFAAWLITWPGITTTLTETSKNTGLSVRGGLMWLIHVAELTGQFLHGIDALILECALSTIKGASAVPTPVSKGYVAGWSCTAALNTNGLSFGVFPWRSTFLPPIPIAAPNLSAYIVGSDDAAALDGKDVHVRVGYTTTPLDARAYAEIAETWSYV